MTQLCITLESKKVVATIKAGDLFSCDLLVHFIPPRLCTLRQLTLPVWELLHSTRSPQNLARAVSTWERRRTVQGYMAVEQNENRVWNIKWYMIWYDMVWYDMIWYGMVWYDTIWYDMIWYDTD